MENLKKARQEVEGAAKARWDGDAALRAEFEGNFDRYLAYVAANHAGHVKTLKGQTSA